VLRASYFAIIAAASLLADVASAYGPRGHLIAGAAAAPLLCDAAVAGVASLGDDQTLGELGLWADRIRGDERWRRSAPWHYVNVEHDLGALAHPPEGDVLWAIEHFTAELDRRELPAAERAAALRFLVHFVVDLHQPLHVGLASDRGGNLIDVRYAGTQVNLHAFWDDDAIELAGLGIGAYVAKIDARVRREYARVGSSTADDWARESLALRATVYRFDRSTGRLSDRYLRVAEQITEEQLIRAAARLAVTLNRVFCG
jgi:nuclease S1